MCVPPLLIELIREIQSHGTKCERKSNFYSEPTIYLENKKRFKKMLAFNVIRGSSEIKKKPHIVSSE
jgi:hypothetical protein